MWNIMWKGIWNFGYQAHYLSYENGCENIKPCDILCEMGCYHVWERPCELRCEIVETQYLGENIISL